MKNLFDLTGQVALVTGASGALGSQTAEALAQQGADVIIVGNRNIEGLTKTQKAIEAIGGKAIPLTCDLSDKDQIEALVENAIKECGKIDILLNCSGISVIKPAEETELEEWEKVININLTGVFLLCKYVGKHMIKENYGRIINISSAHGAVGSSVFGVSAYATSKGGEVMMTRQLAAEWAQYGITCNVVGPGLFLTDINADIQGPASARYNNTNPMSRPGKPHELDSTIIYLASKASSYVNGQFILVDGGYTIV